MEPAPSFVTVVSGYPRSGTSLMMQMLAAGGLEPVIDDARAADEHNPRGYYELQASLDLTAEAATEWVQTAVGKAVKVMAYQLKFLPPNLDYRVIFMRRVIAEVLASWDKMGLTRRDCALSERERVLAFKTEYAVYEVELERMPHMRALYVPYNDVIADPAAQAASVRTFLNLPLDIKGMVEAVQPTLYRNRG